jgi:hypothetical protein
MRRRTHFRCPNSANRSEPLTINYRLSPAIELTQLKEGLRWR